jgi:hypothetical protein
MSTRLTIVGLLVGVTAVARVAGAQPVGSEFRVNTYTTTNQYGSAVAADALGNFVVVWNSYPGQDSDGVGVFGQRFDARGTPRGGEFAVNTFVVGHQYDASVAKHAQGAFTVIWTDGYGQDGDYYGIFGQRYEASGDPAGSQFQVNASTFSHQFLPDVAYAPAGTFVVVWTSAGQDGSDYGIFGQRFSDSGVPLGSEFPVNTSTAGRQTRPAVAVGPAGFVVVWDGRGDDGETAGIFGQRFDAGGNRLGLEFLVNSYTTGAQDSADVAIDEAGRFVVVWDSFGQDGDDWGNFGQRFDAMGAPLGAEFRVNSHTTGAQWISSVARDPDGDFVVAWTSTGQVGLFDDVFAQRFSSAGTPRGLEFRINTHTSNSQSFPAVASLGDENFVVSWTSRPQDDSGDGIFAQLWGDLIFANGFDAGP